MTRRSTKPDVTLADYRALAEFRYERRRYLALSDQAARFADLHRSGKHGADRNDAKDVMPGHGRQSGRLEHHPRGPHQFEHAEAARHLPARRD